MDRYWVAPARPVCLSSAGPGGHLRPAAPPGRRSGGAEIGIFTAERYFNSADVIKRHDAVLLRPALLPDHQPSLPPSQMSGAASDVSSQSGRRTAASSEASWNSRSGLLSGGAQHSSAAVRMMKGSGCGAGLGNVSGDRFSSGGSGNTKKSSGSGGWRLFGRECPCAGRKAVDAASSEPRSPATDARFSAQSVVDECIESAIFKAIRTPSPPPRPVSSDEEPAAAKMKVTVTPGSRAFPLSANDVPTRGAPVVPSEAFAAAIGRRAGGGGLAFHPAASFAASGNVLGDEPPRASLEVFRPIDEDSVMLADPPPPPPPLAMMSRATLAPAVVAVVEEETMSDASSDLFDLESFAASSSYPTASFRGGRGSRRNSNDDDHRLPYAAEEPALSECGGAYAPSEASVVWSVATAEGGAFDAASAANFSSAASACMDEFRFVVVPDDESPAEFTAAMSRSAAAGRKKGGGGFLNSCRCEKAVSVGPTPVRMVRPPVYPSAAKKGSGSAARCHPAGRVHVPVRT